MRKNLFAAVFLVAMVAVAGNVFADIDGFLRGVSVEAKTDLKRYSLKLSAQFGTPVPEVDVIIGKVADPADAFMVLHLSQISRRPPETVLNTYMSSREKGWGVMAKQLGIKPGSAEFHALKRGDLHFTGEPDGSTKGKTHGKGKKQKKI